MSQTVEGWNPWHLQRYFEEGEKKAPAGPVTIEDEEVKNENECYWCDEVIEPQHMRTVYDGEPHHIDCAALAMDNEYSH